LNINFLDQETALHSISQCIYHW